jgi:SEFIR domain/NACHT domain
MCPVSIRVFISYTHDSEPHRDAVRRLGERLRDDGVNARLDRWVPGTPPQGWPAWMEDELEAADFVIVVCSAHYYDRYRGRGDPTAGRGGRFESNLIRDYLYADRSPVTRYVPVLSVDATEDHVPDPLRYSVTRYRLEDDGYDDLYRFLTAQHAEPPPPLGSMRRLPASAQDPANDDAMGSDQRALFSDYLRTLIDRLGSDRWPADARLGGPLLKLGQHEVDLPAKDVESGGVVTAAEARRFRRLVVLGGPGAGKTWFAARAAVACARVALEELEGGVDPRLVALPVFATVAAVRDQPPCPIRDRLVAATLTSFGDPPAALTLATAIAAHEDVVLLLDSLDEAPGSDELLALLDACRWSVVLTTRPAAWRDQLRVGSADDEACVSLEALSYPGDVRHFVHAWFGSDADAAGELLLSRIAGSRRLQEVARVPLLLAFVCLLGHDDLADDPDVLLERTINRLLHGVWKHTRSEDSLRLDRLHAVLREWAWEATGFAAASMGLAPWSEVLDVAPAEYGITAAESAALAHVCPIVGPPDFDSSRQRRRFVHRVLQEHLVASAIVARTPSDAAAILRAHLWASDDWREVLPAVVRRHPQRVQLCACLLESPPFADLPPESLPSVDFEGSLGRLLMTLAASADPGEAVSTLAIHVHAARLRLLDSIERTLRYGLPTQDLLEHAERSQRDLARTTPWGIGTDADIGVLADRLVPRTGHSIPNRSGVPIKVLGLTGTQRSELREIFLSRLDEDDGSFGRLLTALIECSATASEQRELLARLDAAWEGTRGWRRDEIAVAYQAIPTAPPGALRRLLVQAIDDDVVADDLRLSWGLVKLLRSIEGAHEDHTETAARLTSWTAAARGAPPSAAILARAALEWSLTDEERDAIVEALRASLRLCSSQEWLDDDDHRFAEDRFVATEICRLLADTVITSKQATSVTQDLGRIVADASDLRTLTAAADAIATLADRFPAECVEAADAVRTRLRNDENGRYLFHSVLAANDPLSAEDAARGILASGEAAGRFLAQLGPQPPEYWAEVRDCCVDAIDKVDEASVEQMWIVEAALHVATALAAQREVVEPIVAAAARALMRVREQPTNQWRFKSMCQLVLGHTTPSDGLAPQIYEVVAYRLSREDDPTYQRVLVSILTDECRRTERIPESMLPVLDRLKATSDETRRLICARYEFFGCATEGEQAEFLELLSTNNDILGSTEVHEIGRLSWPEATQEQLWSCVLTRLSSENGTWWRRTSLAETLTSWARTPDQRAQLTERLAELLVSGLPSDSAALRDSRGLGLMSWTGDLPTSGLDTELGKFVRFVRKCDLPEALLRDAHDALVGHAAVAATLSEQAALLECAGALVAVEAVTAADTERALALLHTARTPDEGKRSQRALQQLRPTIQDLLMIATWPAPPSYDLLRVARRSASAPSWYALLQDLTDRGLLAATYQSHAQTDRGR